MSRVLPKAPGYTFIDANLGSVFVRDRVYKLDEITDNEINLLLEKEPAYWSGKFQKVTAKPKRKRKEQVPQEEE